MSNLPTSLVILAYVIYFVFGAVIGSFMNVCCMRLPKKEDIVRERSHCDTCGYELKWYDLIPVFSYIFLGGRCRKCKSKIPVCHFLMEVAGGCLYILVLYVCGLTLDSLLYCLLFSALLALGIIDFKTYEIPVGFNIFIGVLGLVRVITDYQNWLYYLIGATSVSLFLLILYLVSKGRAIGGGDVKLMAAAGLLLGWKEILFAFALGCVAAAVIHLIRMKVAGADRRLALGPYLAFGIATAALWGEAVINWYLSLCFPA